MAAAIFGITCILMEPMLRARAGRPAWEVAYDFAWPRADTARIVNRDGNIEVRTQPALDEVRARAVVRVYLHDGLDAEAIEAYLSTLFAVSSDAAELKIESEPAGRPPDLQLVVDYELTVPEGTDIVVENGNGNIRAAEGCGTLELTGRNSDIEATRPRGPVTVTTTNGRIRVLDASNGAQLRTVNGNVYAHMHGGFLDAATTNGAIVARIYGNGVTGAALRSVNGGISVFLPEECHPQLQAHTHYGAVRTNLEDDVAPRPRNELSLEARPGPHICEVRAETGNGNVTITKGSR